MSVPQSAVREPDNFRLDINGLRAWAVVAVVLYHFGVPGISGGFVGVDVFFVISGFLMSGIIVTGLERSSFSLWNFYLARARRILPALIVLCIVTLLLGWFILMPEEYQLLGKHARESLLFSSNLTYQNEAGYFDRASHQKWLLHTWSLSVEWQFYLLQPLLLLLLWRFFPRRSAVIAGLLVLALLSLGLCIWLTKHAPDTAFYVIQTRAWELLLGGMVYLFGARLQLSDRLRKVLELSGLGLIVVAILLFDGTSQWPGWRALLPTAGCGLVLLAAQAQSFWTGNYIAQWLGNRSYSIYLWHWPLVVGLVYLERLGQMQWLLAGLFFTLLLGHLSYHWVEVSSRRWLARVSVGRSAAVLIAVTLLATVSAQLVRLTGFPERLPAAVAQLESERHNRNPRRDECLDEQASCIYGGPEISAILLGDSHADAVVTALQAAAGTDAAGVLFRGGSGCLISFGVKYPTEKGWDCEVLNRSLESSLPGDYLQTPLVVITRTSVNVFGGVPGEADGQPAGRPAVYFSRPFAAPEPVFLAEFRQHYIDTACKLAEQHPVYLMRPIPEMGVNVPNSLGRALLQGKSVEISISRAAYHARHAFVWDIQDEARERCGVRILDPLPYLCDDQRCPGSLNGRPLYADDDHLSEFGNRLLIPMFAEVFRQGRSAGQ